MPPPAELVLHPLKGKAIRHLIVSLVFVAIGAVALSKGDLGVGLMCTIVFGLAAVIFVVQLWPGASYLRLTSEGFIVCSLFRVRPLVRWTQVSAFRVERLRPHGAKRSDVVVKIRRAVQHDGFGEEFSSRASLASFEKQRDLHLDAVAQTHPQRIRIFVENKLRIGGKNVPAALRNLALQLIGSPSRIARIDSHSRGTFRQVRHEPVAIGDQMDVANDAFGAFGRRLRANEREHSTSSHGSANEDWIFDTARFLPLLEYIFERHFATAVEDEAEHAFLGGVRDDDDRLLEIWIVELFVGYQNHSRGDADGG